MVFSKNEIKTKLYIKKIDKNLLSKRNGLNDEANQTTD